MSELLDAEAMKKAAFAVFAKANENNLKPETIKSLWPSQHYPHWDGLAEAAIRAYLSAAPSPSPAPGVVEGKNRAQGMVRSMDQWRNMVPRVVSEGSQAQVEYALIDAKHDIEMLWRALASLSQPAKGEREGGGL